MRVTQRLLNDRTLADLQTALEALERQQRLVSSGRRIGEPSDDPAGAAQAVTVRSRQALNEQFQRNVAEARSALTLADSVLQSVRDTMDRAREAAVQGANGTNDAVARRSIGDHVDQLLEALVSLANSRGGRGEYIFGGQESLAAPYRATRDAGGRITAVEVNARGIDAATPAEVAEGVTVATGVSGTAVFGAPTDPANAFDVLVRLRDDLYGLKSLALEPDVTTTGAVSPSAFLGIDAADDLAIAGPRGSAAVALTAAADDPRSSAGAATSAIALAARINAGAAETGVTATVTRAVVTYRDGTFGSDLTLDGSAGRTLVINGQSIAGSVSGETPAARRDALVALINAASDATGITAAAVPGTDDFALVAEDGRNIAIETDDTLTGTSVNATVFGFARGLTGPAVVARGGVRLAAGGEIAMTVAPDGGLADQVRGEGTTGLQASLDALTQVLDRATVPSTLVGTRLGWLDLVENRLGDESVVLARTRSRIEDLDFARAVQDLKQIQTAYEAAMAAAARLLQRSLLDFLR